MIDAYRLYTLVISVVINIALTRAQDVSICNFTTKHVPPPPPQLSKSYTTTIEWKNLYNNSTMIVKEYYNGIDDVGSQDIYMGKQYTKVIYDTKESQYLQYTEDQHCKVSDLGSFTFLDDKVWISAFNVLYGVVAKSIPVFQGQTTVRNMTVHHWQTCIYVYESRLTAKIDFYFTVNWDTVHISSQSFSPVRFEILGSVKNSSIGTMMPFHVIGDFFNYDPQPDLSDLQTYIQLPPGVFCYGKKSSKPLNPVSAEFSILYEIIDDKQTITYEQIWYNNQKKLIRRDYKKADNTDPDATMEIFDFSQGIHYTMDPSAGTCAPADLLKLGDRYVYPNGNNTIRMISTIEFFHIKNSQIQYVGYRKTRGITCDVWAGRYIDPETNINTTIEWYFNKGYSEAVGGTISYSSLTRINIWEGSSKIPKVMNVLKYDSEAPTQDVYSVGLCYKTQRIRTFIHLRVTNGSLSTVSDIYLKDSLHKQLTARAFLPALRMADVSVYQNGPDLYFDGSLLEKAPFTNDHIVPKPPKQHELNTAFKFLKANLTNKPYFVITNASKPPLVVQALGVHRLDYSSEFSTAVPTPSTPFRTPPTPEIVPPTMKPEVPTTYKTPNVLTPSKNPPSSNTGSPCTCPPTNCSTQATVTCPPVQPNTQCNCPSLVCPDSPKPLLTCPSPPPCAIITCPPPKPCTPRACRQVTCSPCKPCDQSTPKCPSMSPSRISTKSTISTSTEGAKQNNPSKQTGRDNSGISSGGAAGLAIGLLFVGFIIGAVVLRGVQIIIVRRKKNNEETPFFSKYLTDEANY